MIPGEQFAVHLWRMVRIPRDMKMTVDEAGIFLPPNLEYGNKRVKRARIHQVQ
jgi:hypothetical protein